MSQITYYELFRRSERKDDLKMKIAKSKVLKEMAELMMKVSVSFNDIQDWKNNLILVRTQSRKGKTHELGWDLVSYPDTIWFDTGQEGTTVKTKYKLYFSEGE